MKNKMLKILSAVIASSILFGSVGYAKDGYMIANAPKRVLASWEVPTDSNALVNALNGVDSEGNTVTKSTDMGNGLSVHSSTGTWSVSSGYLYCAGGRTFVKSNNEFSDLDKPFELDVAYTIASGLYIRLGKSTEFGDAENDYYELSSLTSANIGYGNNKIVLSRVKDGTTTVTSNAYYQWGATEAKLTFDGSKLSLSANYNETLGSNEYCKLDITEPVKSGRVYFKGDSNALKLKSVSLSKPAGSAKVNNFYVNLSNFTAADVSKANMEQAGWMLSSAKNNFSSVDGQIITGYGSKLRYDGGSFGGNYTITAKIYKQINGLYVKFGYQDDNNYYALVTKYLPVSKVYNTQTQTVDTITRTSYLTGGELYLIKVSQGVAYLLGNKTLAWNGVSRVVTINMSENEDGSETINVTAPVEFTYTDVSGDADGNPFTNGKFYYTGDSEGTSKIDYVKIYPTNGTTSTTFDFYVDGVEQEAGTLSKGITTLAMPVKYAGTINKIIAALYEDHEMTDCKVYTASDFYFNENVELFDTSDCGENTEISIMMWNALDEVKSIVKGVSMKVIQ